MNIFKKCYCRIYQGVFRILIPFLPYRKPELIEGCENIANVVKRNGFSSALLVTDKQIRGLGLTRKLEESLQKENIKCVVYDDVIPNPTISCIEKGLAVFNENKLETVIAFGGGSVMDAAKIIGARAVKPGKSIKKMKGLLKIGKKLPLLVAIPTTAGTGSEVTLAAVVTDDKTHHKYPINDFCLIPRYACLDASLTVGLPPHITSTTGLDALTHSVEAFIGKSTTRKTRECAIKSIKLIKQSLLECYTNGANLTARADMLKAAYYAGLAFTVSYVGYVHAIAHSLGGKYGVPHGLANAVVLPVMLRHYGEKVYKPLAKLSVEIGLGNKNEGKKALAEKFLLFIENLNKKMGIPEKIKELKEEDIEELSVLAEKEGNPLYPVPMLMDAKELAEVYKKLLI